MREPRSASTEKSPVLPSHRVPAHLARRFHQICLGVTAEILLHEDLTPLLWGVMAAVLEQPGSGQRQLANSMGVDAVNFGQMIDFLEQKGLIKRQIDPDDRRARQLYVTRRGTDLPISRKSSACNSSSTGIGAWRSEKLSTRRCSVIPSTS